MAMLAPQFRSRPASVVPVRFFILALVGFVAFGLALVLDPRAMALPPGSGGILLLHLCVLGWVTPAMMGANYQLVPVVLGRSLPASRLPGAVFWLYAAGVWVFLAGWALRRPAWVAFGGAAVGCALLGFAAHIAAVRLRGGSGASVGGGPVGAGLGGGVAFLAVVAVLGPWLALAQDHLVAAPRVLPWMHAGAGLAGWFGLTIMGAGYQLAPFFAATPKEGVRGTAWTALALVGGGALWLLVAPAAVVPDLPGALAVWAGLGLWGIDTLRIVHRGRQAHREPAAWSVAAAAAALWLGASAAVAAIAGWASPGLALAGAFLGIMAGPSLLIVGQLQKILPFMAALDASVSDKRQGRVPKTEALFPRGRGFALLGFLGCGCALTAIGLAVSAWGLVRLGAAVLAVGALGVAVAQAVVVHAWYRAGAGAAPSR